MDFKIIIPIGLALMLSLNTLFLLISKYRQHKLEGPFYYGLAMVRIGMTSKQAIALFGNMSPRTDNNKKIVYRLPTSSFFYIKWKECKIYLNNDIVTNIESTETTVYRQNMG